MSSQGRVVTLRRCETELQYLLRRSRTPAASGATADAGTLGAGLALSQSLHQFVQMSDSRVVRSSLGAGLIWDSPFGPLRANYASPMSKASYDVTQRFRFSAGGV